MNSPTDYDGRIEPTMGQSRRRNPDAVLVDKKRLNSLYERKAETAFPLRQRIACTCCTFYWARFAYQTELEHDRKMPGATGYRYAQFLRAAHVGVGLGVEPVASKR